MQSEVKCEKGGRVVKLSFEFYPQDLVEQYVIEHSVCNSIIEYLEIVCKIIEESRGI